MNGRLTVAATLGLLLIAGSAGAVQPWLQDRRYGEGQGIQVDRFAFHPGISTEFGYDSNFFQRAESESPTDAWRLRITPSLSLNTVTKGDTGATAASSDPMFTLEAKTFFAYSEVFGSREVRDQRNFDAGVGGRAEIAPHRVFGADVFADFLRNGEPSNVAGTGQTFDRGTVRGGAGVSWRPGGGLFDWRLGYEAAYAYFEDEPYARDYDNIQQSIVTNGRWKILPRSGLLYDARYTFIRYRNDQSPQPSGDAVQARVGFGGLVTSRVSFLLMGGWNSTYYEATGVPTPTKPATPAQNYDGYVGQAELKFYLTSGPEDDRLATGLSSLTAGFTRSLGNSYLGAFYTRDRFYIGSDTFLGGVFVASLNAGYSIYSYPVVDTTLNPMGFQQGHIDAQLFAEYRFSDTVGLNGTLLYDQSIGAGPYKNKGVLLSGTANTPSAVYDNLEYSRFQAYVGVRLFW